MRASPVSQDTVDLLITAIYMARPASGRRAPDDAELVAELDRLGQHLWDQNHASVSFAIGERIVAPRYSWRPVGELLAPYWLDEQVLQLEHTRLFFEEVSCHHPGWDDSEARSLIGGLARAIDQRLSGFPIAPSPVHSGVMEYAGLSRFPEEWTREIGWRANLSAAGAAAVRHPGSLA